MYAKILLKALFLFCLMVECKVSFSTYGDFLAGISRLRGCSIFGIERIDDKDISYSQLSSNCIK